MFLVNNSSTTARRLLERRLYLQTNFTYTVCRNQGLVKCVFTVVLALYKPPAVKHSNFS